LQVRSIAVGDAFQFQLSKWPFPGRHLKGRSIADGGAFKIQLRQCAFG